MSFASLELGKQSKYGDKKICWSPQEAPSPHLMIIGQTGSGKSTLGRYAIDFLLKNNYSIHMLDLHGDMSVDNEQAFVFTIRNSVWGINIFDFEKDDYDNGGPFENVEYILKVIAKTFFKGNMGSVQEKVLRRFFRDVYKMVGIENDNIATWNHPLPKITDIGILYNKIVSFVKNGAYESFVKYFYELEKLYMPEGIEGEYIPIELQDDLAVKKFNKKAEELASKMDRFREYCLQGKYKDEFTKHFQGVDLEYYASPQNFSALEKVGIYLESLCEATLFNDNYPKPKKGYNRYDISAYANAANPDLAIIFVDIFLQRLFRRHKGIGEYKPKDGGKVHTFIVFDESKIIVPKGKDKEDPMAVLNRLFTEIRKYGCGIIIISQRLDHFSNEIISSIHTKVILKSDSNDFKGIIKKTNIPDISYLERVSNHGKAIVCEGHVCNIVEGDWRL